MHGLALADYEKQLHLYSIDRISNVSADDGATSYLTEDNTVRHHRVCTSLLLITSS